MNIIRPNKWKNKRRKEAAKYKPMPVRKWHVVGCLVWLILIAIGVGLVWWSVQ